MTVTLADCMPAFLDDMTYLVRLRPHTLRAYRYELTAAARALPVPLNQLTICDLERWIARDHVAASTVARRIATLSRFFTWAVHHQYCLTNPLAGHEPLHARSYLPRPIKGTDRIALEQAFASAPPPYRLIFTLLRETGMRATEPLALTLADVTLTVGREGLRIPDPKNGTERIIVLGAVATPKSLRLLRAYLKAIGDQPPHAPLFRSRHGTPLSYDALHYQWHKVCAAARLLTPEGKPRYTLHQLRHTRGSELVEQGQSLDIVQRVLGHRDPRSTQQYAALHEDQVRAALAQGSRS